MGTGFGFSNDRRHEWLRAFFVDDTRSRSTPSDLEARLFRKLQMIDDATTDRDLRVPPRLIFRRDSGRVEAARGAQFVRRGDAGKPLSRTWFV